MKGVVDLDHESSLQQVSSGAIRMNQRTRHPERRTILSSPPSVNAPRHREDDCILLEFCVLQRNEEEASGVHGVG